MGEKKQYLRYPTLATTDFHIVLKKTTTPDFDNERQFLPKQSARRVQLLHAVDRQKHGGWRSQIKHCQMDLINFHLPTGEAKKQEAADVHHCGDNVQKINF